MSYEAIQDYPLTVTNSSHSEGTESVLNVLIHRSHGNALGKKKEEEEEEEEEEKEKKDGTE